MRAHVATMLHVVTRCLASFDDVQGAEGLLGGGRQVSATSAMLVAATGRRPCSPGLTRPCAVAVISLMFEQHVQSA